MYELDDFLKELLECLLHMHQEVEELRELTFKGFLSQYVRQLSEQETNSLYKLAAEASSSNPRLKEPLFLYALYTQKVDVLLLAAKDADLKQEYLYMAGAFTTVSMEEALQNGADEVPAEYQKVWRSYMSRKNRGKADDHTKELMRQKVKRLQEKNGVTNYRIYTDLKLNPGNLNAWLKHGDCDKVSLNTARRTLQYVQSRTV